MNSLKLIVANREAGKTTFLLNEFEKRLEEEKTIFVLDSATEHEDKSLIKKIEKKYNVITYNVTNPEEVILNSGFTTFLDNFENSFPTNKIKDAKNKIICFDLAHFLERAHEALEEENNLEKYNYLRNLYRFLSLQIIFVIILLNNYGIINNVSILMDEIELPIFDFEIIPKNNMEIIAAVHPENSFGTFYKRFKKINLKPFKKDVGK
ncbi:MAG TPA: hypothetical protein GX690_00645 [Tenericutes bacterium]|nr:hypothetical protein [Mycoplasmatota bacterium]